MINSGEKRKCLLNFERSHGMEEGASKVLTFLGFRIIIYTSYCKGRFY